MAQHTSVARLTLIICLCALYVVASDKRVVCSPAPEIAAAATSKQGDTVTGNNAVGHATSEGVAQPPARAPSKPTDQKQADTKTNTFSTVNQQSVTNSKSHVISGKQTAPRLSMTDKVKRGLATFMNNLNPAPYFVPPPQVGSQIATTASKTTNSEPSTIISHDGPMADAVIKGPNRLVQSRPLGVPLRWGRRR